MSKITIHLCLNFIIFHFIAFELSLQHYDIMSTILRCVSETCLILSLSNVNLIRNINIKSRKWTFVGLDNIVKLNTRLIHQLCKQESTYRESHAGDVWRLVPELEQGLKITFSTENWVALDLFTLSVGKVCDTLSFAPQNTFTEISRICFEHIFSIRTELLLFGACTNGKSLKHYRFSLIYSDKTHDGTTKSHLKHYCKGHHGTLFRPTQPFLSLLDRDLWITMSSQTRPLTPLIIQLEYA